MDENRNPSQRKWKEYANLGDRRRRHTNGRGRPGELDRQGIGELQRADKGGPGRKDRAQACRPQEDQRIGEAEPQAYRLDDKPQGQCVWQVFIRVRAATFAVCQLCKTSNPAAPSQSVRTTEAAAPQGETSAVPQGREQ